MALLHLVPRLLLYPAERGKNILRAIYPTQLDGKNCPPLPLLSPLAAEELRAQHRVAAQLQTASIAPSLKQEVLPLHKELNNGTETGLQSQPGSMTVGETQMQRNFRKKQRILLSQ